MSLRTSHARRAALTLGILVAASAGCKAGIVIPSADPHPQLHLAAHDESAGLRIEYTVADEIELARQPGVPAAKVLGFHATLANGFENAFKPFFAEVGHNKGDFVIEISRAEPSFIAEAASVEGSLAPARAVVNYEARLIAHRKVIGSTKGRATSKQAVEHLDVNGSVALGEAVADMYEQIVADLFAQYAATYKRSLEK